MCKHLKQCLARRKAPPLFHTPHDAFPSVWPELPLSTHFIGWIWYQFHLTHLPSLCGLSSPWRLEFKIQSGDSEVIPFAPAVFLQTYLVLVPSLITVICVLFSPPICHLRSISSQCVCSLLRACLVIWLWDHCWHLSTSSRLAPAGSPFQVFSFVFELTKPQISSKEKNSVKPLTYMRLRNQVNGFPD